MFIFLLSLHLYPVVIQFFFHDADTRNCIDMNTNFCFNLREVILVNNSIGIQRANKQDQSVIVQFRYPALIIWRCFYVSNWQQKYKSDALPVHIFLNKFWLRI